MLLILSNLLKQIYKVWMRFARILSWINTRIILVIMFYLVFTPVGLVMRLFRIDLLERNKNKGSYWKKKERKDFNFLDYERRF
ncbi:MAG: SxtJ family membrane protein [Candidatus Omnitrophota bacterium]